jgi:hypothetical protein
MKEANKLFELNFIRGEEIKQAGLRAIFSMLRSDGGTYYGGGQIQINGVQSSLARDTRYWIQ